MFAGFEVVEIQPRGDLLFIDIAEELFELTSAEQPADGLVIGFPFKAFLSPQECLYFLERTVCPVCLHDGFDIVTVVCTRQLRTVADEPFTERFVCADAF